MRKSSFVFAAAIILFLAAFSFSACGGAAADLPATGRITDISVKNGNESLYVTWTDEDVANAKIVVYFYETQDENKWGGWQFDGSDPHSILLSGLKNDVTYAVSVSVYSKADEELSSMYTSATPREITSSDGYYDSHTYDEGNSSTSMYIVPKNKQCIELKNVKGKKITYAVYNKNSTNAISAADTRFSPYPYVNSGYASRRSAFNEQPAEVEPEEQIPEATLRYFEEPENILIEENTSRSAFRGSSSDETFDISNPKVGQTKYIWADGNAKNQYKQRLLTLFSIGYKGTADKNNIKCMVWADSNNVVDSGSRDCNISLKAIEDLTKNFMKYYQMEENVYGETRNTIYSAKDTQWTSIDGYPTKDIVNIVLIDIDNDGTTKNAKVGGYFWGKDYYDFDGIDTLPDSSPYRISNKGKYFYIDIPHCNYNSESKNYSGNDDKINTSALTTLFHEYQHMINFNQKMNAVKTDSENTTWYNEMLSMLCEDMLQKSMKIDNVVQKDRIPLYNSSYFLSGTAEYLENDNTVVSYSTAYSFGCWLVRNYGGVELVTEMSTNNTVGKASVVNAVNAVNSGKNATWESLMEEYIQAVAFNADYAASKSLPTLKKTPSNSGASRYAPVSDAYVTIAERNITDWVGTTTFYSYSSGGQVIFDIPVDLWSKEYSYASKLKEKNQEVPIECYGPYHFASYTQYEVRPTGVILHYVDDKVVTDNKTLWFSESKSDDEIIYVFIQDPYDFYKRTK